MSLFQEVGSRLLGQSNTKNMQTGGWPPALAPPLQPVCSHSAHMEGGRHRAADGSCTALLLSAGICEQLMAGAPGNCRGWQGCPGPGLGLPPPHLACCSSQGDLISQYLQGSPGQTPPRQDCTGKFLNLVCFSLASSKLSLWSPCLT